jgi:hypothetical protein
MQRSFLTTKPHEGHEGFGYLIMNFVLLCFKICAPRANLMTTQNISDSEIPPAKARRAPSSDNYFLCGLCVFAGDIPNLRLRRSRAESFVVKLSFSVAARHDTFFVVETRQIGASICHGFGMRNLKRAIIVTVPRHSNYLLLRNALTYTSFAR